jgi:hypothetical protein
MALLIFSQSLYRFNGSHPAAIWLQVVVTASYTHIIQCVVHHIFTSYSLTLFYGADQIKNGLVILFCMLKNAQHETHPLRKRSGFIFFVPPSRYYRDCYPCSPATVMSQAIHKQLDNNTRVVCTPAGFLF